MQPPQNSSAQLTCSQLGTLNDYLSSTALCASLLVSFMLDGRQLNTTDTTQHLILQGCALECDRSHFTAPACICSQLNRCHCSQLSMTGRSQAAGSSYSCTLLVNQNIQTIFLHCQPNTMLFYPGSTGRYAAAGPNDAPILPPAGVFQHQSSCCAAASLLWCTGRSWLHVRMCCSHLCHNSHVPQVTLPG